MPSIPISTAQIHYGGTLNKRGRLSSRPIENRNFALLARIEKLVRLDLGIANSGIVVPDADIARMIGRSARHVRVMRNRVEYLRMRIQIQTGIALETDASAKDIKNLRVEQFKSLLPDALRVIADELTRPATTIAERKFKASIAQDMMDREGSFTKISRSDSHIKVEHDYSTTDALASELLNTMDNSPAQNAELDADTRRVLEANSAFSNSETLSHDKQQHALDQLEIMAPLTEAIN